MVEKIIVKKLMTDEEIASKEGEYFPEKFYKGVNKYIIDQDTDVYRDDGKLLLKYRQKEGINIIYSYDIVRRGN